MMPLKKKKKKKTQNSSDPNTLMSTSDTEEKTKGKKKKITKAEKDLVAFSRGNKGFIAMTNEGGLDKTLQCGLPAGQYCNVITGFPTESGCDGETVTVDGSGNVHVKITNGNEPIFAIHVGAKSGGGGGVVPTASPTVPPTAGPTNNPPPATTREPGSGAGTKRTVVFVKRQTAPGQDLFLRGGINHDKRPGCSNDAASSACALSITHNQLGTSAHYDKQNAWSMGDTKLDWYGAQAGQGSYNGQAAEGTPAVWTSSDPSSPGYQKLNRYGDHYWMVDVELDCDQTENGWFEFKSFLTNHGWEGDIGQVDTCGGTAGGAKPYVSSNHMARCGYLNVFEFDNGSCKIDEL